MKNTIQLFSKFLLLLVFVGCSRQEQSREEKVAGMINRLGSPFLIASVHLQSIMDKSQIMEEGTLPFTYYTLLNFFLSAESTGIDYATKVHIAAMKGTSFIPDVYAIFRVGDQKKFEELLEKEVNATIKEKEGIHYVLKSSEHYVVAWDEEFAVIATVPIDLTALLSGGGDQGEKTVEKIMRIMRSEDATERNEERIAFLKYGADIAMRCEGKGVWEFLQSMPKTDEGLSSNWETMIKKWNQNVFIHFRKGSIEVETRSDPSSKLKERVAFLRSQHVDEALLKYSKSPTPLQVGTLNLDLEGLLDFLETNDEEAYRELADELKKEVDYSIDELKKSLSGEVVYMVDSKEDLSNMEESVDSEQTEWTVLGTVQPSVGVAIGVTNRELLEKGIARAIAKTNEKQAGSTDRFLREKVQVTENGVVDFGHGYLCLTDQLLFITEDSAWANQVAAGKGADIGDPEGLLSNKPFAFYSDCSNWTDRKGLGTSGTYLLAPLHSISAHYADPELFGWIMHIKMTDSSQNALKVITSTIGTVLSQSERNDQAELETVLEEAASLDGLDEEGGQ